MTPRQPRPDLRDRKEQSILQAAAAVFAERGFRATRIADIAERAGIGKGTLYEYFRGKEDLFLRLFDWYIAQASASMTAAGQGSGSALADLTHACDSLLVTCGEMKELYPLTMEFWSASTSSEFRDRLTGEFRRSYARFRGAIADLIRAGIAQGEIAPHVHPESVAAVLVGALDGIILQAWFDPEFDPVAAGRHFLDVLPGGIGARGRAPTEPPQAPERGNEA